MSEQKDSTIQLHEAILDIIFHKGLKATTMDHIAASLSMSKRTLYEIYGSKQDMLITVLSYGAQRQDRIYAEIIRTEPNVIRAIVRIFLLHRDLIASADASFFRDMDEYFAEVRKVYHSSERCHTEALQTLFRRGVEEGMFRTDVNFRATWMLIHVQLESLKRMEEFFPPDFTLLEAFETITVGFLRSIASPKGMELLDSLTPQFRTLAADRTDNQTT